MTEKTKRLNDEQVKQTVQMAQTMSLYCMETVQEWVDKTMPGRGEDAGEFYLLTLRNLSDYVMTGLIQSLYAGHEFPKDLPDTVGGYAKELTQAIMQAVENVSKEH